MCMRKSPERGATRVSVHSLHPATNLRLALVALPPAVPLPVQSMPLAQAPTPSEEFLPEDKEYWTKTVLGAAWPVLIGLGAAAGLLLIFLLWWVGEWVCWGSWGAGGWGAK